MLIASYVAVAVLALGQRHAPPTYTLPNVRARRVADQTPLTPEPSWARWSYTKGDFSLHKQDNSTCASYGEGQWTGTVDVSDERRLFFWFAESRNEPLHDPIIIWMNGGPGASGLIGLFTEMGPCVLEANATKTSPNPWAWNNNASVVFLDQPAGVGFSTVADGAPWPNTDMDGAEDFQVFLNVLFESIFPERADLPIYIAGESYAGHFVPAYTKHIFDSRTHKSESAFYGNITGMIHVNALLELTATGIGSYELLCSDYRGREFLTPAECEYMWLNMPDLERRARICRETGNMEACINAGLYWAENFDRLYRKRIDSGERNNYNIHLPCINPPICTDMKHGNITEYLNKKYIKSAIGVDPSQTFMMFNETYPIPFFESGDNFRSSANKVAEALDLQSSEGYVSLRLLVLNGNEDYIVNTPGQIWMYDNLLWSGHAEYRINKWRDLPESIGVSGFWKGTGDSKLVFEGLDGAGHGVPGDVPEAAYNVLQRWLQDGWR